MFFRNLALILLLFSLSFSAKASNWAVETHQWGVAVIAKVPINSKRIFAINFEYARNCDPLFSSYTAWQGRMGSAQSISAFPPNTAFLKINQSLFTFNGAIAKYPTTTEVSMVITNEAWNVLVRNPNSLVFYETNRSGFTVPTFGLSSAISRGLQLCMQNLRRP